MQVIHTNYYLARQDQGLNQSEVGDLIGTAKSIVSSIETGRSLTGRYAPILAELYGIPRYVLDSTNPSVYHAWVRQNPKAKENFAKAQPKVQPPVKLVQSQEPKPMYAARPTAKVTKVEEVEAPPVKVKEEELPTTLPNPKGVHELGIVQTLVCTSSAANKYLKCGWVVLCVRPKLDGEEFLMLLGSSKQYSNEDFERLKSAEKANPRYSPRGWKA